MARDNSDRDRLSAEIAALLSESTLQLRQHWKALYGTETPRRASRDLMTRAIAYRLQERAKPLVGNVWLPDVCGLPFEKSSRDTHKCPRFTPFHAKRWILEHEERMPRLTYRPYSFIQAAPIAY